MSVKMKEFLILLFCYLNCVHAGNNTDGACATGIPDQSLTWIPPLVVFVEDNLAASELIYNFTFTSDNVESGTTWQNDKYDYILVELNEKTVTFTTTEKFPNIQKDYYEQKTGYDLISLDGIEYPYVQVTFSFICDGSSTSYLDIRYYIKDNNDPPEISDLEYQVPMPVMPQVDLSIYSQYKVVDYDFLESNKVFAFSSDSSIFSVGGTKVDNWESIVSIRANSILTTETSFILTVTDSETNPNTVASTITITNDKTQSLDIPKFVNSYYEFNLNVEDNSLVEVDGSITIESNKDSTESYELSGDNANLFTAQKDGATFALSIATNADLSVLEEDVRLTLTYTSDVSTSTTIIIYLLKVDSQIKFTRAYYTGNYNTSENTINMIQDVNLNVSNSAQQIVLSFDSYNENLGALFDSATGICTITVQSAITTEDSVIITTLNALVSNEVVASTAVILYLPTEDEIQITFTRAYYSGNYTTENTVSMTENIILVLTDQSQDIQFSFDSYNSNLQVEIDKTTGICTVSVQTDITTEDNVITTTLNALVSNEVVASTAIILYLPTEETISFSSSLYKANYVSGQTTLELETDNSITINGADQESISIVFGDYSDNFKPAYDSNSGWIVNVENVPEDVLKLAHLVTKLTAQDNNNVNIAQSAIVVSFPEYDNSTQLVFSNTYFKAKYSEPAGVGSVELNEKITFVNGNPDSISLNEYGEYFQFENSGSNEWGLICNAPLPDDLKSGALVTLITATDSSNELTGTALLIISLTQTDAPKFTRSYYQADYVIDENEIATVALQNAIRIENKNQENVKITPTA